MELFLLNVFFNLRNSIVVWNLDLSDVFDGHDLSLLRDTFYWC